MDSKAEVLASFHGDVWADSIRPAASIAFAYQPVVLDDDSTGAVRPRGQLVRRIPRPLGSAA